MSEVFLSARKFQRLLRYLDAINLGADELCSAVGLDAPALRQLPTDQLVSAIHYSHLYLAAVKQMEEINAPIPWAAGMGSTAFRLTCYCMIDCDTLGEALQRAQEFSRFAAPLSGHRIEITGATEGSGTGSVQLRYEYLAKETQALFAPPDWEGSGGFEPIVFASGLRIWYSLCGWLIGRCIETEKVSIAGPYVAEKHDRNLACVFTCPVNYDAECNLFEFEASELQSRIVQDNNSLEHFLGHALHYFWIDEQTPTDTAAAIKSMISNMDEQAMPRFEQIADRLHMSASTLRRRLLQENTTYQQIKDECREATAIEYLHQQHYKIHEISDLLGFAETSSFVRSFRKWTGMTPKAYRDGAQVYSSMRAH